MLRRLALLFVRPLQVPREPGGPLAAGSLPELWQCVLEDWNTHGRDWTKPGFRALAFHRFGEWRSAIRPRPLRAPFSIAYRALYRRARNLYRIELPSSARIGRRVVFEHQHGIVVHGNAEIGDGCVLRQGVTLGIRHPDRPREAPKLGRDVQVGAGAKILGDVTIGDGAVIGANAVVLCDVPAGAMAVGIPARVRPRSAEPLGEEAARPLRLVRRRG